MDREKAYYKAGDPKKSGMTKAEKCHTDFLSASPVRKYFSDLPGWEISIV